MGIGCYERMVDTQLNKLFVVHADGGADGGYDESQLSDLMLVRWAQPSPV